MKRSIALLFCISLFLALHGSATVAIGQECTVSVVKDSVSKSLWVARPALIRIQAAGFDISQRTQVTFTSDASGGIFQSVIPLVKIVGRPRSGNTLVIFCCGVVICLSFFAACADHATKKIAVTASSNLILAFGHLKVSPQKQIVAITVQCNKTFEPIQLHFSARSYNDLELIPGKCLRVSLRKDSIKLLPNEKQS